MAELPQVVRTRRGAALLVLAALLVPAGCVGLDTVTGKPAGPPKEPVCKVVVAWVPQVVMTPDVLNDGKPLRCLAGRMYLFGEDLNHQVAGDGSLVVDLYDLGRHDPVTKEPVRLERWEIDARTLSQKLLKHDFWGWGYTLALPFNTYRTDLMRVELRARYQPKDGSPLFAESSTVTLAGQGDQPAITTAVNVSHAPIEARGGR
jgi:hypothetical protein